MNLASITHDLADLLRTLREPGHPEGASEAYADELAALRRAVGRVPAALVNALADAARDLASPRWIGTGWYRPLPAPTRCYLED